jgi:transposase
MRITRKIAKVDTTNKLTVAFDVAMKTLEYYSELRGKLSGTSCREVESIRGNLPNTTAAVSAGLKKLAKFAQKRAFSGLHIVCEPTGVYGNNLMRTARRLGHTTAWVSGESVHKARVLENNDGSKDDIKDPRVIYMLATMGKELIYRELPPLYRQLRELNRMFDAADERRTQMKCELHHLLVRLFCDYPMSKDFLYCHGGAILIEEYRCNPHRIVANTHEQFCARMRAAGPLLKQTTLDSLYECAGYSAQHCLSEPEQKCLEQRLEYAWHDYQLAHQRREHLREQIAQGYWQLWEAGELVPYADGKVFKTFHFGRILGETGPLGDFAHWRVIFKYGGVNLRTRQSGKYKGKLKMSKKGRVPLRGVLGKIVFRLVRKHEIFGPYYHRRKSENPEMPGTRLMANVERKLLRMVFSMGRRRDAFDMARFTHCQTQYRMAA